MLMKRAWLFFWLLCGIWGSSFLLMKLALAEMSPGQVAFSRVAIAAVGLNIAMFAMRREYPKDWRLWRAVFIVGLGNTAIPFTLIAWGEHSVGSGLAGLIQAVTPMFAVVIAHFVFVDDRMTVAKIIGVAMGFVGIMILSGGESMDGSLGGILAIVAASACYAIFSAYSRHQLRGKMEPLMVSTLSMTGATIGAFVLMYLMPLAGEKAPVSYFSLSGPVVLWVLILGLVNTLIAYAMFYYTMDKLGTSRSSMITFGVPVVSMALGWWAGEPFHAEVLWGAVLILAGILVVNLKTFGLNVSEWLKPRPKSA
jgi:drug/metabolite transporter (DMT)-like permease